MENVVGSILIPKRDVKCVLRRKKPYHPLIIEIRLKIINVVDILPNVDLKFNNVKKASSATWLSNLCFFVVVVFKFKSPLPSGCAFEMRATKHAKKKNNSLKMLNFIFWIPLLDLMFGIFFFFFFEGNLNLLCFVILSRMNSV